MCYDLNRKTVFIFIFPFILYLAYLALQNFFRDGGEGSEELMTELNKAPGAKWLWRGSTFA